MNDLTPPSLTGTRIIEETIVPGGGYWSRTLSRGQVLRITDVEGCQAVDFICFNAKDYTDRYSSTNTIKMNATIFVTKGTKLYSDDCNVLMSVVDDTYGQHDTICGCCNGGSNRVRYGVTDGPSCRRNFIKALSAYDMGPRDVVPNVNIFMYLPVGADGRLNGFDCGNSRPGERIELKAEMDVLAVFSNCPQLNNPVNNYKLTPIGVTVYEPQQAG
jgi:urea carboxylase-associated protein 1